MFVGALRSESCSTLSIGPLIEFLFFPFLALAVPLWLFDNFCLPLRLLGYKALCDVALLFSAFSMMLCEAVEKGFNDTDIRS